MRLEFPDRVTWKRPPRAAALKAVGVAGLVAVTALALFLAQFLSAGRGPVSRANAAEYTDVSLVQAISGQAAASTSPVPGANFGHSVAVYGTTAVVGAPDAANGQGVVYAFSKAKRSWRLTKTLADPNRARDGDFFGYSVAISGSTIAVGAPEEKNRRGVVYVLGWYRTKRPKGTRWYPEARLYDPLAFTRAVEMTFGASVALVGDTLLIGAPGTANNTGVAYVYTKHHNKWYLSQRLALPNGIVGDNFGYSVAIAGGTILIGAPGRPLGPKARLPAAGAVYVFGRPHGPTWRLVRTIDDPGRFAPEDNFGFSVSLTAGVAVIGAPGWSTSRGTAYIFAHRGESGWRKLAEFTDPARVAGDNFGDAVSITSTAAVIGASYARDDRGVVYILRYHVNRRHRSVWRLAGKLADPVRAPGDYFGSSVSMYGGVAVVGAVGTSNSTGAAYVFTQSKGTLKK